MSDRRSSSDLGASAEATLSGFPFPERDWESDARAIEARLTDGSRRSTDEALLAAPLPSEAGEPSSASATATPLTNSGVRPQSLAELARRSVEKKQANQREMARESLAMASQQRPSPADLRAVREAIQAPQNATPPVASSVSRPEPTVVPRASAPTHRWPRLALVAPALAMAAAAWLWFRQPSSSPMPVQPVARAAPSALADNHPTVGLDAAPHPTAALGGNVAPGIDPETLPSETSKSAEPAQAKMASASGVAASGPVPTRVGPSQRALQAGPSAAATDGVEKSLPPDPGLRPADSTGGELTAKPSTGAVQAALGSVMSGARHCVAGDDAPSSAVVVFGSDGRVQRVAVSGAAAGKSSAGCIEAQLSRARVQPFAASSFSVNATVRPE